MFGVVHTYASVLTVRDSSSSKSPNTGLAMIVLYVITGCVSALFCLVIISGAIRAMRHPERYGPRAARDGDGLGGGQSRASGLTRAILDTFPVVKFGDTHDFNNTTEQHDKDLEAQCESPIIPPVAQERDETHVPEPLSVGDPGLAAPTVVARTPRDSSRPELTEPATEAPSGSLSSGIAMDDRDVVPAAIGRETCPICIVDFEDGDDLRVLPCEGHHRFHQQCVDPWLLELSSSCPICRHDFLALETILSGESQIDLGGDRSPTDDPSHHFGRVHRFSRYLRFAQRRHREQATDPTDPYMPRVSDTET